MDNPNKADKHFGEIDRWCSDRPEASAGCDQTPQPAKLARSRGVRFAIEM
ncbi:hypothetical protein RESH_00294 [Rhodopirellula europaea SH398]|uniref:Uncharacterized protein n=2 Tax=Rhodopirellula europaea TaxID=1263866 RepID=M5SCG0_9BACT|nr:hypothetical protein RE6C_04816 [Rhodopirellula europaea 6C]EMI29186.1 hypothetical protein RESH_00294 [Rhodopirellula europaea SH398]